MQEKVYNCGCALEMPNREVAREPYTREELERKYEQEVRKNAKYWGVEHYYTNGSRNAKTRNLQDFDEGKVVQVYRETYYKNGKHWCDTFYSDGTKITSER